MGLYTENIVKREENNKMLEQYADDALLKDHSMLRVEEDIEELLFYIGFILGFQLVHANLSIIINHIILLI